MHILPTNIIKCLFFHHFFLEILCFYVMGDLYVATFNVLFIERIL